MSAESKAIAETIHFVEHHGYTLLFCWVLAEQGAIPLPSIPLLLAAGSLARAERLQFGLALVACVGAALIADTLWFQLGRRRGTRVLRWLCRISLEPDSCVRRTEDVFGKYGMRSLLVSKFVPGLNAVAAPMAGNSEATLWHFYLYDAVGAVLWSGTYLALGYVFSEQLEAVLSYASRMGAWLLFLVGALFGLWIGWKLFQRQRFLHSLKIARITPAELRSMLDAGETPYIIDLRSGIEHDPSPIPHSIRVSIEDLTAGRHDIPRDREVILFCT
ncbi:MAG TPA: VTT domain-containing protein [Candidatus Acidoferrum sp.]|nr:VTT domain-containing protein [Candidatus Acidoferrum sp.]